MAELEWVTTAQGVKMPGLVYGTAWKKERTENLVVQAVQAGFRGIDTACQPRHYHEPGVGEALKKLAGEGIQREALFLQTKFTPLGGHDPDTVPYDKDAPVDVQVAQSFETSKKNLGTATVDSLVIHSPLEPHDELMKAWGAMEKIFTAGGARQLGISNCYDPEVFKRLYQDAAVKPAVLQNRFYKETGYDRELRAFCAEHQIFFQSFWTLTANPHLLKGEVVRALSDKHDRTPAQIFFRALRHLGIVPLTGTTSEEHMREDLAIFEFELGGEDVEAVRGLFEA